MWLGVGSWPGRARFSPFQDTVLHSEFFSSMEYFDNKVKPALASALEMQTRPLTCIHIASCCLLKISGKGKEALAKHCHQWPSFLYHKVLSIRNYNLIP